MEGAKSGKIHIALAVELIPENQIPDDDVLVAAEAVDTWKRFMVSKSSDEAAASPRNGILRFIIHEAKSLEVGNENVRGDPYCVVKYGAAKIYRSCRIRQTQNPVWDEWFEMVIPDRKTARVHLQVKAYNPLNVNETVGDVHINLDRLMSESNFVHRHWVNLNGVSQGKICFSLLLTEVIPHNLLVGLCLGSDHVKPEKLSTRKQITGLLTAKSKQDTADDPTCGFLDVELLEGHDLIAADSNGKSDPYVVVKVGDKSVAKTSIKNATLDPAWNEHYRIPWTMNDDPDLLTFRVFDHDQVGGDDPLGWYSLSLRESLGSQFKYSGTLKLKGVPKGEISVALTYDPPTEEGELV